MPGTRQTGKEESEKSDIYIERKLKTYEVKYR